MIEYNNKKIKLPFVIKSHSTVMVKRTNRSSGQSIDLPTLRGMCLRLHNIYE